MKLLKIKVKIDRIEGRTHYTYPQPQYDMLKIVFGPIYEGGMDKNCPTIWARGSKEHSNEYILVGVLNNSGVVEALKHVDIEEINETQFLIDGNQWTEQTTKITDQDKVLQILAKVALGTILTQAEKDSIDENNPASGIGKSKSFQESLDISKVEYPD